MHLLDDDGRTVLANLAYDAWGQLMSGSNPIPYSYKAQWGYYTDVETGILLLTHRYLDPAMGRFLTRDPIGSRAGANLYAYVNNRVVVDIDPWGLLPKGKPRPPTWRPIPTPRDPFWAKIFRLVKLFCVVDCVVYAVAVGNAIHTCLSEGQGDSFICCVHRELERLPGFVGGACAGCILQVACNFSIPGVGFICGAVGGVCYELVSDIVGWACKGVFNPPPAGSVGGGGQGGCWGPAYHCYPAK